MEPVLGWIWPKGHRAGRLNGLPGCLLPGCTQERKKPEEDRGREEHMNAAALWAAPRRGCSTWVLAQNGAAQRSPKPRWAPSAQWRHRQAVAPTQAVLNGSGPEKQTLEPGWASMEAAQWGDGPARPGHDVVRPCQQCWSRRRGWRHQAS
jgi:hypothetical protein